MHNIANKKSHTDQIKTQQVSNFTFYLFILYLLSFFLHFSARVPAIGVFRPDLLLAVLIWLSLLLQRPGQGWALDSPVFKILTVFLVYLIISIPLVEWPGSVLKNNLPVFLKGAFFLYFTAMIVDTEKRFKVFILVFIVCQLIRILEPLYLHIVFGYWGSATYLGEGEFADRLSGGPTDYIDPNGLGMIIAITFPFIHYLWMDGALKEKFSYLLVVPLLLYTLVLTMSRSGVIALMVVFWNIFKKSNKKLLIIMMGCIAIGVLWSGMTDVQRDRYISLTGDQEVRGAGSAGGRVRGMVRDFGTALNRPIVGHGLGTSIEAIAHDRGARKISHTLYAEIWIETGIIGLIIFLLFLKSIYDEIKGTVRLIREAKNKKFENDFINYAGQLTSVFNSVFWMLIIFSIALFGLSEWHWYLFAGMVVTLKKLLHNNLRTLELSS